ncbi:MAG: 4Fe-4S binding protein [Anaerolineaceae bacterium]|nr:4Fe-4S binding protein [Anaerolineaceae bacterium]
MSARTWLRIRKITQFLSFLLFMGLLIYSHARDIPNTWSNLFYRLDPLIAMTAMLAGRTLIPILLYSLITLILTVIFGRVWCGWFCPLGTLLEWFSPKKEIFGIKQPGRKWRKVKFIVLIIMVSAAIMGNQSLLFLDPISILSRTMTTAIWPALRYLVFSAEAFLYQFEALWEILDVFHNNISMVVFRETEAVFSLAFPIFLTFAGLFVLNVFAERFWCRYLCPLGGLLGLLSRFSFLRREVHMGCTHCGLCASKCPTGTIDPMNGNQSDPAECLVCYECIPLCKNESNSFKWQFPKWRMASKQDYDPARREVLLGLGAALGGVALAGVEPIRKRQPARMLRPPGVGKTDFYSLCLRCSACVNVCPTQGLQPSGLEGGWQNLMTPRLIPRLGACTFNCNACTQVCPSGAIPPQTLEEKQTAVIGLASVNTQRCLPWAYETPCIICEESCPLAEKAIKLEEEIVLNEDGVEVLLQKPVVMRKLCIGCGICEQQCPMGGEAAIRVFSPTDLENFLTNFW